MAGIMDRIFGGGTPGNARNAGTGHQVAGTATPPPVPNPNDKIVQQNPGADPANVPGNNQSQQTQQPISPLDDFKDLWKTPTPDPKAPPADPLSQPLLNNDPAKFAEAAKKLNFAQQVDPEIIKKALGGDVQSFMDAMNSVAQTAFVASSQLAMQSVEGAARTNNDRFQSVLDKKFSEYLVKNTRSENPVLSHPSAQPMLDLAKRQLLQQHPEKSPAEIHQMAEQYLTAFAGELQGNEESRRRQQNTKPDPFDFSNYGE